MSKAIKSFEDTLAGQMQDPVFREGFLQAQAELKALAKVREVRRTSGLGRKAAAQRMKPSRAAAARFEGEIAKGRSVQRCGEACCEK